MKNNRLITIPMSHYCEKARWALEWSRVPFVEEGHAQAFHVLHSYKAAKSFYVPVLVTPEKTLADSTKILQWVDGLADQSRKLYPSDTTLRARVEEFEDFLDEGFGVMGRLWLYTYMLHENKLIFKYMKKHGIPWHELTLLPIVLPLLKKLLVNDMEITSGSQTQALAAVNDVFDQVSRKLRDGRPFLFGERFSAADLTFAALAAPVLMFENYGVTIPRLEELPDEMRRQIKIWRAYPAGQFALRMYKDFRRQSLSRI